MAPLALILFLLTLLAWSPSSLAWSSSSARRSVGCMFQNELCSPYEICVNDGMFGRCHRLPLTEVSTYHVSPAVIQRFRILLEKLSSRGLTWEDEATQRILDRELSTLRRTPPAPPTGSRPGQAPPDSDRLETVGEELGRSLQTYLRRLAPQIPAALQTPGAPGGHRSPSRLRAPQGEGDLLVQALRSYLSGPEGPRGPGPLRSQTGPDGSRTRLLQLAGAPRWAARGPLSPSDKALGPEDLDQLSSLIADALQVVDLDAPGPGLTRDRPEPRDLELQEQQEEQEQGGEERRGGEGGEEEAEKVEDVSTMRTLEGFPIQEAELREPNVDAEQPITGEKRGALVSRLLAFLDRSAPDPALQEVALQKKDTTQSLEEVEEVEGWIREAPPPAAAVVRAPPPRRQMSAAPVPELRLDVSGGRGEPGVFGYVITDTDGLQTDEGLHLMEVLAHMANIQISDVAELSVVGPAVTFKVHPNRHNVSTADVANVAVHQRAALEKEAKLTILEAGVAEGSEINQIPNKYSHAESTKFMVLTVVSLLFTAAVPLASTVVYCLRHRSHHRLKQNLSSLGSDVSGDATSTYQELCRQRMAVKPPSEPLSSRITSVSSQFSDGVGGGAAVSPSARGSTSSWGEEPSHSNMDISTGHMILAYMEDHLKNKNRLEKEWEALCCYQAEPNASTAGLRDGNAKRNRSSAVVAYDHSRISLKVENSQGNSDYINASPIMDHDPRSPAYIATQGPLPSTVADFWQMVWENGCVVIVMLTPLVEGGVKQCYHYWPDEGSNLYHIYEVNLVSEHVWCDDFLVRSFYLKNMQTNETRTVTQFHFLTWPGRAAPASSRSLLDLRRKVNRCYKGRSCPIIVHCSDGAGRTGTYILIDMVLNKMAKGAKEIDIAATLEHLRDQRPGMVQTKEQFEFVLTAVAEEVNVILKALPQ